MNIRLFRYIVQIVVYTIYKMIVSKILLDINLRLSTINYQLLTLPRHRKSYCFF